MKVSAANHSFSDSARQCQIAAPSDQFLFRIKLLSVIGFLWTISLSGQIPGANAQNSPASCNTSIDYIWSYNSLNQDPCTVATYLGGVCDPDGFSIPLLPNSSSIYGGPSGGNATTCRCSSVYYMMLGACSGCQGGGTLSWSNYNADCPTVYPSIFIENIPSETKVPHWAYLNITLEGTFNAAEAQLVGDAPESTGNPIPTSTPSSTSTPKKSHSESGPIAGGVVGGIIFLLFCALAIIYFRRRSSRRGGRGRGKAPSSQVDLGGVETVSRPYPTMPAHPQTISSFTGTAYASLPSVTPKFYDPSDPSTFPPSMLSTSPSPPIPMRTNLGHSPQGSSETNNSMGYFSTGYHSVLPSQPADGRQGVAEV